MSRLQSKISTAFQRTKFQQAPGWPTSRAGRGIAGSRHGDRRDKARFGPLKNVDKKLFSWYGLTLDSAPRFIVRIIILQTNLRSVPCVLSVTTRSPISILSNQRLPKLHRFVSSRGGSRTAAAHPLGKRFQSRRAVTRRGETLAAMTSLPGDPEYRRFIRRRIRCSLQHSSAPRQLR